MQAEFVVVGGPNGAGKTTFAEEYAAERSYTYVGADASAAKLAPDNPLSAQIAAGREFAGQISALTKSGQSIVVESTLSGKTFRRILQQAREAGHRVTIVYLFLGSVETCIRRVRERVSKGGHHVPEPDIRRRFLRRVQNFWHDYRPLADQWPLIYNSEMQPQDVAVGTTHGLSVRDAELFSRFEALRKADS